MNEICEQCKTNIGSPYTFFMEKPSHLAMLAFQLFGSERSRVMAELNIEVEAESLEEAREQVKSQIPDGLYLLSEQVISDGKPRTVEIIAETTEEAFAKAQGKVPVGAEILEKKELSTPQQKGIPVPAVVSVTYRTKAKISAKIGEKKEETKTIYSQVQVLRSDVLLEPANAKLGDDGGDGGIGGGEGILCTDCGTVNPTQARFCTKCGRSLEPMEQMSTMQIREGSSFSPDDVPAGLNAEASTAPLLPSPDSEEAAPLTGKQEAMSSIPPVSSQNSDGSIPMIGNRLEGNNHGGWRRRIKSRRFITIALRVVGALLALALFFFGGNWLYSVLPAMSATVTIVPIRQTVQQNYTFTLGQTNDFTQKQVASRVIKYTTSTQSESVKSSVAHGHIDATQAQGNLVFSSVSRDVSNILLSIKLGNGLILDVGDYGVISSQHATTVPATVEEAGSAGNLPANFVDGTYNFVPTIGNSAPFTAFVSNPAPFTGGMDAYDGPIVQQQDIEQGQSDLTAKLQQEAQQKIPAQLQPGEALLTLVGGGTVACTPQVHADHQDGDPAAAVTVTEHMDCQAVAYDAPATLNWVQNDLQQQVQKTMGAHFGRVGDLQVTTSLLLLPDIPLTSFQYLAQGEWVLQLDAGGQQAVARGIEGLSQVEARAILLRTFHSKTKSLVLSTLWGQHLPIDINGIKIIGLASLPPGT